MARHRPDPMALAGAMTLPTQGIKQATGDLIKANIRQWMIDALADPPGHAYAVASGRDHFRRIFVREFRSFFKNDTAPADELADSIWAFLREQWQKRYPHTSPTDFLDAHAPVSPPTEQEIEDAWELEIASDEASMKVHYEGSARTRKGADLGAKRGRG